MGISSAAQRTRLTRAVPGGANASALIPGAAASGARRAAQLQPDMLITPANQAAVAATSAAVAAAAARTAPPPSSRASRRGSVSSRLSVPVASPATSAQQTAEVLTPMFIMLDARRTCLPPGLATAVGGISRPCYSLHLPPREVLLQLRTVSALAAVFVSAIRSKQRSGPYIVGGIGLAASLAFEIGSQLQASSVTPNTAATTAAASRGGSGGDVSGVAGSMVVEALLLVEDAALRMVWDQLRQPWCQVHDIVMTSRPDLDEEDYRLVGRTLAVQVSTEQLFQNSFSPDQDLCGEKD